MVAIKPSMEICQTVHEYAFEQRSLFGMSASWGVASATQISRSGAAETGTLATQVAEQIGGYLRLAADQR